MGFVFYVIPFEVTTFPTDNPVRFLVIDGRRPCTCPGACKHEVTSSSTLHRARQDARVLHQRGVNCGGCHDA